MFFLSLLLCAVFSGLLIGIFGWMVCALLMFIPIGLTYWGILFKKPEVGFYTVVVFGFVLLGLGRYLTNAPVGLGMDGILVATYIALIFSQFHQRIDWTPTRNVVTLLAALWFGYSLLQFANPEMQSLSAYIGGVRGISFYMMLLIPLVLLLVNSTKRLNTFFLLWGALSILASLKGFQQFLIGVDPWERAWLNAGGAETHVIMGKLRIFSFMSDAGQFGANQAYSAVVAGILATQVSSLKKKLFFTIVAVFGILGLFLSGTRGAIAVPLAGMMLYFVLRKSIKVLVAGILLMCLVFIFFNYTNVGQSNYQIRRMRTAFDMNDPSLQVRLQNQKILKTYLADKPFGGGIGHAGIKAQRFLPNAFLSNVATDSWYVLIWAEQGIVGLCLHLFILLFILFKSMYLILFRIRDPDIKLKMTAMTSGYFGVLVASYGNAVLGTMPTAILIYSSMALMMNAMHFDQLKNEHLHNKID
jgi:hypothetical protein